MLPWTSPDVDLLSFMNNCPVGMVCGEGRGGEGGKGIDLIKCALLVASFGMSFKGELV